MDIEGSSPGDDLNERFGGTIAPDERYQMDEAALAAYLRGTVESFKGPIRIEQFKGGQSNPTFLLETPGRKYVMRRKPPGRLLPSAHAVDREYRIIDALSGTDVPVPHVHCLCEDENIIGSAFYIMDFVEGRTFWNPAAAGGSAAERTRIFDEMNGVLAALHGVDYVALGLADFGKPGDYFSRQIARWTKQYRASEAESIEAMNQLIEWLPAHIPSKDETSLVHGDYRLDNLIFHPTEARILAVLDWELATLGHPLADLSYHCMIWHLPAGVERGLGTADLAASGIPTESDYIATYCRRTRRTEIDPAHWSFCIIYNLFRAAAISQGILGRVREGTAASAHAAEAGKIARRFAERAWEKVEDAERAGQIQ